MTEYIKPISRTPKMAHYPDEVTVVKEPIIIARKYTNSDKTSYMEIPIPISFITSMIVTGNSSSIDYEIIYNFNRYKKDKKDKASNISNNDFESIFVDKATYDRINTIWRGVSNNGSDMANNSCSC